jgi:hypothetical protein
MAMTYGELEQALEDANFAACQKAYTLQYRKYPGDAQNCEDGEWDCVDCPWKDSPSS